ncbi:MAG: thioredoxin [Flavobacteriales bacterium]
MALDVTDATFEEVVLKSEKPVLVDFWATWCGPCKMIAPAIEALATDFDGKAVITKVDVDNNNESAASYGVRNIPTILFFKGGEVVDKHVGVATKDVLAAKLEALM